MVYCCGFPSAWIANKHCEEIWYLAVSPLLAKMNAVVASVDVAKYPIYRARWLYFRRIVSLGVQKDRNSYRTFQKCVCEELSMLIPAI
jgi:hypothetical protein